MENSKFSSESRYLFDDIIIERGNFRVSKNGEAKSLTPRAFDVLVYLIEKRGRVVEKQEIFDAVWKETFVTDNALMRAVKEIRRELGDDAAAPRYVKTVHKRGYQFIAEVAEQAEMPESKPTADKTEAAEMKISENESKIESPKIRNPKSEIRNPKWLRAALPVVILFAAVILAAWFLGKRNTEQIKSIAVLPFQIESGSADIEYLSDGITESIINNLSQISDLKVMSRNSAFRFRQNQTDAKNIAAQLGVETLVTGDIRQIEDKLVISIRLIDGKDESQIWGSQFVKTSGDIIGAQNEIAQAVVSNLRLKLTDSEQRQLAKRYTENSEAYRLYLKGRYHTFKLTPPEIQKGISYFQQTIEVDPSYALAYTGLSDAYRAQALSGEIPATDVMPKAKAAALKALEIDPSLAEAHTSLSSIIFWYDWNPQAAEDQLRRALQLNPNNADAHIFYAYLLSNTGRHADALAEAKRAGELDPLSLVINALEGQFLLHAGKPDEALAKLQKTFELDANFGLAHLFAASALIEKGMHTEAIAEARKAGDLNSLGGQPVALLCYALVKSGKPAEAREELEKLLNLSKERYVSPYQIALIYNGLGERDKTFAWLERGFEQRDPRMTFLKVEPKWNNLRAEPQFAGLMRRMNLE